MVGGGLVGGWVGGPVELCGVVEAGKLVVGDGVGAAVGSPVAAPQLKPNWPPRQKSWEPLPVAHVHPQTVKLQSGGHTLPVNWPCGPLQACHATAIRGGSIADSGRCVCVWWWCIVCDRGREGVTMGSKDISNLLAISTR